MNTLNYTTLNQNDLVDINAGGFGTLVTIVAAGEIAYDFYKGFKKGYNETK